MPQLSLVHIGQLRFAAKLLFNVRHIELIDVWALSVESLKREEQEAVSEDHKRSVADDRSIG
ncbi:hypothetical protein EIP91_001060, partial [Steccherinum ochraceum]